MEVLDFYNYKARPRFYVSKLYVACKYSIWK